MAKVDFQTRSDLHIVGPDIHKKDVEIKITGDTDSVVNFILFSSESEGVEEIFCVSMNDAYFVDMAITTPKKGLEKTFYNLLVQVVNPSNEPEDLYLTVLDEEREWLLDFGFSSETEASRMQKRLFETQDAVHLVMQQSLLNALLQECKTKGELDFIRFAEKNIKTERIIYQNHEITVPMMAGHIEMIVSEFIAGNRLNGQVDKDTYVDTD